MFSFSRRKSGYGRTAAAVKALCPLTRRAFRAALTAVLAGQNPLAIRAKEDYERAFTRKTEHYNQADASANVRKSVDTTYLGKPSRIEEAIKQAASTGHD